MAQETIKIIQQTTKKEEANHTQAIHKLIWKLQRNTYTIIRFTDNTHNTFIPSRDLKTQLCCL